MSYHTGQTFTFGEQPSATKWNYLWENDDSLRDGSGVLWNNNQELQAKNSSGTTKKLLRLDDDNYMRLSQLPYQSITTNSTREDVLIQHGWSFMPGTGAINATKTITFPAAYAAAPIVMCGVMGFKNGSDPTTPGTVDGEAAGLHSVDTITTTNFILEYRQTSGTFTSNTRIVLCWIAIGTKA